MKECKPLPARVKSESSLSMGASSRLARPVTVAAIARSCARANLTLMSAAGSAAAVFACGGGGAGRQLVSMGTSTFRTAHFHFPPGRKHLTLKTLSGLGSTERVC